MKGLTDFADGLSPMLVKELRQGVRSRIFANTLLLLQGSLVLLAIIGLLASAAHEDTESVTGIFWVAAGVFLMLFLPLNGLNAISSERTANTLELIFLTRLSPRRIVVGKWLAIVAQISLLVFTILPYIILRYFLGGVDLWFELLAVGGMLLGSAVLSAITVSFSPLPSFLSRGALVIGIIFGLYLLAMTVAMMSFGRGARMFSHAPAWKDYTALGIGAVFVILLMLEFGAARIAPPAENHSSALRIIGLFAIAAGVILYHAFFHLGGDPTLVAFCFTAPILIGALCETPRMIGSIYRPFVRRGFLGQVAGRFLYPGWPSATLYVLLVTSAVGLEFYFSRIGSSRVEGVWLVVIIAGALLMPAAIIRFFGTRLRYPLGMYVGVQTVFTLLHILAEVLASYKSTDFRVLLDGLCPTSALLTSIFSNSSHELMDLPTPAALAGLSALALICCARRPWREIRALEKKARLIRHDINDPAPVETAASTAA